MSQENVELVREAHRAFNAHDLDRLVEFWHPDCEFRPGLEAHSREPEASTAATRASAAGGRRCTRPSLR